MDILHRRGEATVGDIQSELPDPPSYSSVRSIVAILVDKGLVRRRADGVRFVYAPADRPATAQKRALQHLISTHFGGSPEQAVTALLDMSGTSLPAPLVKRLREAIRRARDDQDEGPKR